MNEPGSSAEVLLEQALALPAGPARAEFLAARCASDPQLGKEVASLLRAHEEAGNFLEAYAETQEAPPDWASALPATAASPLNAALHAAAFLKTTQDDAQLDAFLARLPNELRQEASERIRAGIRVRRWTPPIAPPPLEDPPPRLPGYRIEHKIGQGGIGVVYRAHDEKLNRPVAIKVLRSRAQDSVGQRLLQEARQTAALSDPAVVTVFSVLDETDPPAIVMELVEGYPLDRFAAHLTVTQKTSLLREVARALAAAHARGLVHRDLKPENVMVGPDMRPRLLDFGLALSIEEARLAGRGFEGTPLYASPEQVRSAPLTPASDVFSFGSMMFKVLTGRPPFAGEHFSEVLEAIATTSPPMLRDLAVGVPEDLQAICLACLAWDPADRPSASEVVAELGRFLMGEPVRVRPKLYDDLLRRGISEQSAQAQRWASQSIISREERDALEVVHRRLLADEDHWIIDARRITLPQTLLSGGTWLTVVATVLTVWILRDDLGPVWRWLLPVVFTATLLAAGYTAHRLREELATATFLAGAALAVAPCTLAVLGEIGWFGRGAEGVTQLFAGSFTNQQVLAASITALLISTLSWRRMKMTGFAWTTATLAAASHLSLLLLFNWLEREPEIQALWCLPLVAVEGLALLLERQGRARWTLPFHLVALLTLVGGLGVMALNGPTLRMLGATRLNWTYLDEARLRAFSFALNGLFYLGLMLVVERSASLDLRRATKLLEILAVTHTLSALFVNALDHRDTAQVRADVWIYLGAALLFVVVAPLRSRWRLLIGGLAGCGLGAYLLVELGLVAPRPFIISLGASGLLLALGAFAYLRKLPWRRSWSAVRQKAGAEPRAEAIRAEAEGRLVRPEEKPARR